MGLLSIIRKIKRKEKEIRILMVGLDNSGKTTIVLRINGEDTSVVSPTLGFNIKTLTYQKYTLNIWDVGGQKTIRSYWRNYFEQTDGLVWVVDSSDLRRLDDCKMELDNLLKEERLSGSSLLILANKQDIKGALTPQEIAKVLNLEAMDKTRHWNIVGCSAYTGEGLLQGFDWSMNSYLLSPVICKGLKKRMIIHSSLSFRTSLERIEIMEKQPEVRTDMAVEQRDNQVTGVLDFRIMQAPCQ